MPQMQGFWHSHQPFSKEGKMKLFPNNVFGVGDLGVIVMLAFLFAVLALAMKRFRRHRHQVSRALDKNRELLSSGKITQEEFETLKHGLEFL
jgi:uncharacterized membrane protein